MFGERILCLLGRHRWRETRPIIDWVERKIRVRIECERCDKLFRVVSIVIPKVLLGDVPKPKRKKRTVTHRKLRGLRPKSRFIKKMWSGKGEIE